MLQNRRKVMMIAFLTLVMVASVGFSVIPPAQAGPISDFIARHRQKQQLKLPPMTPPFSKQPVKDMNVQTASFTSRLKKRFTIRKPPTSGTIPFEDKNVSRASQ
jgi:hypothetical protein